MHYLQRNRRRSEKNIGGKHFGLERGKEPDQKNQNNETHYRRKVDVNRIDLYGILDLIIKNFTLWTGVNFLQCLGGMTISLSLKMYLDNNLI